MPEISIDDYVKTETGKCFITIDDGLNNNEWVDLSALNADSTIKAFTVSQISDNSLKEIKITTPPTKTSYYEGQDFDKSGMVVKAYYNNGEEKEIEDYNISNGTKLTKNQTNVTISYEGKTIQQPITVDENSIVSMQITTPPATTIYKPGHNFETTGMVIEVTYKDGTKKEVTDYTITNGTNLKNGQTSITITYGEKTLSQSITVTNNAVKELEIITPPTKIKYVEGQNFDKTGMVVKATYEDGEELNITDYTIEGGENLTKDKTQVTIKYEDKEITQTIEVVEKAIESIQVSKLPTKTAYTKNKESLDLAGGKIKLTYNNNSTEEIDMTNEQVETSGFSNQETGKVTITLTYLTKITTFEVEIVDEVIAQNSKLDNATAKITNYKIEEDKILIDVEVTNIERNQNNDSMEYYYYLSPNQDEENGKIENWVKINTEQTSNDKITFQINSKDLSNYGELSSANTVYLYIKEIAIKGGDQKVAYAGPMELEAVTINEIVTPGSSTSTPATINNDTTTAKTILPNTGIGKIIIIIAIVAIVGVILYIRYKKVSKYL